MYKQEDGPKKYVGEDADLNQAIGMAPWIKLKAKQVELCVHICDAVCRSVLPYMCEDLVVKSLFPRTSIVGCTE